MRPKPPAARFPRAMALAALSLAVLTLAVPTGGRAQSAPAGDRPVEARVDALFAPWNSLNSPGTAVAVVKDGIVVYRNGFGSAQLEYGIPITPSTVFHVASVSKQFTALAITMLEAAGKLSADDDIRKYLPEMADFGAPITIRHLLHHTSGLRDQWDLVNLSGKRFDDVLTQGLLLDRLFRQKELNFAPGAQHLYSNSGYTLLAEIVGRVTGRPFTDWTRDNIFKPLGMSSTHFHLDHTEIVRNRAYSYDGDLQRGFSSAPLNYANVGATSLFTTVEDMANWIRNYEDQRIGGPAVWDKMLTKGVLANGTEIDYARGIMHGKYRGLKTIGHSGGDAGFRSHVVYVPGEKFGVAVFSNLASFDPGALALRIADIYLAERFTEPAAPAAPAAGPAPEPVNLPAEALNACAGTFFIEASQLLRKIVIENGRLFYVRSADNRTELIPTSPTRFKMANAAGDVYVEFADLSAGRYNAYTVLETNGSRPVGKRIEPFEPDEAALKEYAGTYYSEELDTRYTFAVRSGSLRIKPGLAEELAAAPLKKDVFTAGRLRIEFQRDGKGRVSGFRVSTGRVLNLRFVKTGR